jgi:RsiW-degrading membrane proteinase PrsW (M82 family)
MRAILALVIALATSVAWSWIFIRRDKSDPEPRRLLVFLFLAGCALIVPCALIEYVLPGGEFASAVIIAPVVEEAFKVAAVLLICWRSRHFNQLIDGTIYAISVALGFAAIENFGYALLGGFGVLGFRVILGPIGHPLFTGVAGFYLARAKFERRAWRLCQGFVMAVLLHAGWNLGPSLLAETGDPRYVGVVFLVAVFYGVLLWRFLRRLETPDAQRLRTALALGTPAGLMPDAPGREDSATAGTTGPTTSICSACGMVTAADGAYCEACGARSRGGEPSPRRGSPLWTPVRVAAGLLVLDLVALVFLMGAVGSCWDAQPACGAGSIFLIYLFLASVVVLTLLIIIDVLVCVLVGLTELMGRVLPKVTSRR